MEQFSNFGQAILNNGSTLTSGATSTVVSGATNVPSSGTFRAIIESEIIWITAVSGSTWTISRGQEGTTAVSHADGTIVYVILTKAAIDALVSVQTNGTETSNRRVLNIIGGTVVDNSGSGRADIYAQNWWEATPTFPVAGNFAWINQGSASITTTSKGALFLSTPALNGDSLKVQKMARPGTNWTAIMRFSALHQNVNFNSCGFIVRDSSAGKLTVFAKGTNQVGINYYTNATTFSSAPLNVSTEISDRGDWWKMVTSSGTLTWSRSVDGENWLQLTTLNLSTNLTTPDEIGFYVNSNNATYGAALLLQSWFTSSP